MAPPETVPGLGREAAEGEVGDEELFDGVAAVVVFREVEAGCRVTLDSAGAGAEVGVGGAACVGGAVGVGSVVLGGGDGSVATPPLTLARGSATSSSGSVLCANCPATAVLAATTTVRTPAVTGAIRRTRR